MKDFIVTPNQMKIIENTSDCLGVSLCELMNNAGKCLADFVFEIYKLKNLSQGVFILAGNGNNSGDGFICANMLYKFGLKVTVVLLLDQPKTELAINAYNSIDKNISIFTYENDGMSIFSNCDIVVDCVFGTGFARQLDERLSNIFQYINSINAIKIACDIPSGANALNGLCSKNTLKCDYTVTFGAKKLGMLLSPAREFCGEICCADIKIPVSAYSKPENPIIEIDMDFVKSVIPKREATAHKGTFGKLLSVCGSSNYVGAAALSTLSALRSGVGICTLATPKSVVSSLSSTIFEATYLPLDEDENGQILFSNYDKIVNKSKTSSAVLLGCGLGVSDDIKKLVVKLIENLECPIILDADGINAILDRIDILRNTKASVILTPHIGELARLTDTSIERVLEKSLEISAEFSQKYGVIVVAKGSGTIISAPDGATYISINGNAGLSRGGSGDVLAGIISSLVAQGISPVNSVCAGVFLNGLSADRVALKLSMQGMLPTDVINELPLLFKDMGR